MQTMHTITFYSYKGGAGRSLLLANVARFAAAAGKNVVALDFDLEAPGLAYKFFPSGAAPRNSGLVGYLLDALAAPTGEEPELDDYLVAVPAGGPGTLNLMPAGRAPSGNYFHDLRRLRLDTLLDKGTGLDLLMRLQQRFAEEQGTDLLLIDARTGITSTNAVTTQILADTVVALTLDMAEQIEGTRTVLRSLQGLASLRSNDTIRLELVVSRIPHGPGQSVWQISDNDREIMARIRDTIEHPAQPVSKTVVLDAVHVLHNEPMLVDSEVLLTDRSGPWTRNPLHHDYLRLIEALIGQEAIESVRSTRLAGASSADEREEAGYFIGSESLVTAARGERLRAIGQSFEAKMSLADQVRSARAAAALDPSRRPDLASALGREGLAHRELGQPFDALKATEESAEIYRELASDNPSAFHLDLARSLNDMSNMLSENDRHKEALTATEEVANMYRNLALLSPSDYRADLARSLMNFSVRLAENGHHAKALTVATDGIETLRELAVTSPAAYRPALAEAIGNFAVRLAESGLRDEALESAQESTGIYRELPQTDPAAYTAGLAASLNNLAIMLSAIGRRDEALAAAGQGVSLLRKLANANPAHDPNLAAALTNLAIRLAENGQGDEAIDAAMKAVDLYKGLADSNAPAYEVDLADALSNLSIVAAAEKGGGDALAAAQHATDIYRRVVQHKVKAHRPNLARSLNNLAIRLAENGRPVDALAAAQEATDVFRELAHAEPDSYKGDLAAALDNTGNRLSKVGRVEEALPPTLEAVQLRRQLARQYPQAYQADLATSLNNLSNKYALLRRTAEALTAIEEAADLWRELAASNPAAYNPDLATSLHNLADRLAADGQEERAVAVRVEGTILERTMRRG